MLNKTKNDWLGARTKQRSRISQNSLMQTKSAAVGETQDSSTRYNDKSVASPTSRRQFRSNAITQSHIVDYAKTQGSQDRSERGGDPSRLGPSADNTVRILQNPNPLSILDTMRTGDTAQNKSDMSLVTSLQQKFPIKAQAESH